MTPPSERLAAPEIDSAAFASTLAAYQRLRRLLETVQAKRAASAGLPDLFRPDNVRSDASLEVMHETRIARARLRHVVTSFVAEALQTDIPKATVVRRVNDQVNALVRSGTIDQDAFLVSELIEWIVEGYPDDITLERAARGRLTPARGRDVIPIPLLAKTERAS